LEGILFRVSSNLGEVLRASRGAAGCTHLVRLFRGEILRQEDIEVQRRTRGQGVSADASHKSEAYSAGHKTRNIKKS
jgi:hypothetical protein